MKRITITLGFVMSDIEERVKKACEYLKANGVNPKVLNVYNPCGNHSKMLVLNRSEVTCECVLNQTLAICDREVALLLRMDKVVGYYTPEGGVANIEDDFTTIEQIEWNLESIGDLDYTVYEYYDEKTDTSKYYKMIF